MLVPLDSHADWGGHAHDLLDDQLFHFLVSVASSSLLFAAHASPPCGGHSALRTMRPGPPQLRSVEHMEGLPNLPSHLQKQADQGRWIHERIAQLLSLVATSGGCASWETSVSILTLMEPCNIKLFDLLKFEYRCHACQVHSAADSSEPWEKCWLFRSSHDCLATLHKPCPHEQKHASFAGLRNSSGDFISRSTAVYPSGLCKLYVSGLSAFFNPQRDTPQDDTHYDKFVPYFPWPPVTDLPATTIVTTTVTTDTSIHPNLFSSTSAHVPVIPDSDFTLKDGGGVFSTADWSRPHTCVDVFKDLRNLWQNKRRN